MISAFNLRKLNDLLKDFYTLTQIRITVFDDTFKELTAYPEHIAPCCQIIRMSPEAKAECIRCDQLACEKASRQHPPPHLPMSCRVDREYRPHLPWKYCNRVSLFRTCIFLSHT